MNLLICFVLTSIGAFKSANAASFLIDRLEASVNSSTVLYSDITRFKKTLGLRSQLDPMFSNTNLATNGERSSISEVVEFLIEEKIITQQFAVNDTDVEQEINSIQSNNKLDRSALKKALKEQGYNFEDYFELIRVSLSKRNLIDRDIRTKVSVSDDDIKNHYYNHLARTQSDPLVYSVKIIRFSPESYKSPKALRDAAQIAVDALKTGEAFEEVAKRLSDDPSAQSGGDLGPLGEDQLNPTFRDQLKKMHLNDLSPLIGTQTSGYFILKLVDLKTTNNSRFEKAKEEIRSQLYASEYQHQIALWLERQKQKSFIYRVTSLKESS